MKNRIIAVICCIPLIVNIPFDSIHIKLKGEMKQKHREEKKASNKDVLQKALEKMWIEKREAEKERVRLLEQEKMKLFKEEYEKMLKREQKKKEEKQKINNINKNKSILNDNVRGNNRRKATFNISYYDSCYSCTQNSSNPGLTASGVYAKEGITIAAPKSIPFGTKIKIDGQTYTVQDRGGAIVENNGVVHLDVYVSSHEKALKLGRYITEGYILN